MFLFAFLCLVLTILLIITFVVLSVGGSIFILLFGDIIVCIFILAWIIKKIFFNNKKQ